MTISLQDLTYRVAGRTLLNKCTIQLNIDHKIGFVGRNGTGKTTLFKLLLGEAEYDDGTLKKSKQLKLATIRQEVEDIDKSVLEFVLNSDKERTSLFKRLETTEDPNKLADIYDQLIAMDAYNAEGRAATILKGLGFCEDKQSQPLKSFSGGWRMRVALAACLFQEPDFMLLDEPTNHLDFETILWLEDFLRKYKKGYLVISHDRTFLDKTVESILHLQEAKLRLYKGNYEQFENAFDLEQRIKASYNAKIESKKAHMQSFVDRFKSKASKAAQAQSRMKAIAKLKPMPMAIDDPDIEIRFPECTQLASPIIKYDQVTLGYGESPILHKISGSLQATDRIALLGANGNGKSTFAKFITSQLKPMQGDIFFTEKLKIGYFHQHQFESLPLQQTSYQYISGLMKKSTDPQIRSHLARFGFGREKIETLIKNLSGGEKARLVFAGISVDQPHILVLDEPTNHLDMPLRESLMNALNSYPGAVIIISHDWHFLQHTVDDLWVVKNKKITPYKGSLKDYQKEVVNSFGF